MSIIDLFNDLKKIPYAEKVRMGRNLHYKIIGIIDAKRYGNFFVDAKTVATWYYTYFASADRKVKVNEYQFYKEITNNNVSYDWFIDECKENNHPEMVWSLKQFMSKITLDERAYFEAFACLIFSLKGDASYEEMDFLVNFFQYR